MSAPASVQAAAAALTDGAQVAALTSSKVVKDAVVDFLTSIPPALLAVGVTGIPADKATLATAVFAVGGVAIGVLYRALLKWATS